MTLYHFVSMLSQNLVGENELKMLVSKKCEAYTQEVLISVFTTMICATALLLTLSLDQNWPHWHNLTEQSGGAVVCHGLVSQEFFISQHIRHWQT